MIIIIACTVCLLTFLLLYFFFKFSCVRCKSNVCLMGKTAVVTGGSSGIGYELTASLLARGCKVIVADRLVDEGIKKALIAETDNPNVELEFCDFGSFKSVRALADKLKKSETKLDILINNVGIGQCDDKPTVDGLILTLQVNYFSPFLLTYLLVDLMKKSDDARIIFTSSATSFFPLQKPIDVTSTNITHSGPRSDDYILTKYLAVVAADMFAEKLKKYNIKSNTYHPGGVKTNIFRQADTHFTKYDLQYLLYWMFIRLPVFIAGQSPKNACQTAVNMVVSKDFKNVTGTFYGYFCPNLKPRGTEDRKFCEKVWAASEHVVQIKPNEKL